MMIADAGPNEIDYGEIELEPDEESRTGFHQLKAEQYYRDHPIARARRFFGFATYPPTYEIKFVRAVRGGRLLFRAHEVPREGYSAAWPVKDILGDVIDIHHIRRRPYRLWFAKDEWSKVECEEALSAFSIAAVRFPVVNKPIFDSWLAAHAKKNLAERLLAVVDYAMFKHRLARTALVEITAAPRGREWLLRLEKHHCDWLYKHMIFMLLAGFTNRVLFEWGLHERHRRYMDVPIGLATLTFEAAYGSSYVEQLGREYTNFLEACGGTDGGGYLPYRHLEELVHAVQTDDKRSEVQRRYADVVGRIIKSVANNALIDVWTDTPLESPARRVP
jgi:hypothetical protein